MKTLEPKRINFTLILENNLILFFDIDLLLYHISFV